MKKIVSIVLSALFLLSLISCNDAPVNNTPTPTEASSSLVGPLDYDDETLYAFSYHLVRSGIDPELKFDDSVNNYEYEEKKLRGIIEVMYSDGVEISSIVGFADNFGYRLNFWNYNKQEWSFYTNVPVKGLSLPMDITFDDDLVYWIHMGSNFYRAGEVISNISAMGY